jgi:hypothetical protein
VLHRRSSYLQVVFSSPFFRISLPFVEETRLPSDVFAAQFTSDQEDSTPATHALTLVFSLSDDMPLRASLTTCHQAITTGRIELEVDVL